MEYKTLAKLGDDDRTRVLQSARRRRWNKDETIFHEGDIGDTFHLIAKGRVGVKVTTPMGEVAMLTVLSPGDSFGEGALISSDERRTATIVALEPTETLVLHRDGFNELRRGYPGVEPMLVHALSEQVRRLTSSVLDALYVDVETRLFRRLVDLINIYDTGADRITIPLTQEDLATIVGTTRPTANRFLQGAVEAGVIELSRGRITVLDRAAIAKRAR